MLTWQWAGEWLGVGGEGYWFLPHLGTISGDPGTHKPGSSHGLLLSFKPWPHQTPKAPYTRLIIHVAPGPRYKVFSFPHLQKLLLWTRLQGGEGNCFILIIKTFSGIYVLVEKN